jgi:Trp operon repressor
MDIKSNELFWSASIEEVKKGYIETEEEYKCIICEERHEKGRIYEVKSELYDARRAVEFHIEEKHSSMLEYLLGMNSTFTGVSEVQRELIMLIAQGLSDREIATELGVAQSTIRNHRYKLREKEKQAKLFLAMMDLLSKNTNKKINKLDKGVICDAHKTATTLDDRFNITDKEKADVIKTYMDENKALKSYPAKEKKKIIVLEEIARNFTKGKSYSEKEVNRILKRVYEDYATIRRALIEYGFIERSKDCSNYWVKE